MKGDEHKIDAPCLASNGTPRGASRDALVTLSYLTSPLALNKHQQSLASIIFEHYYSRTTK